MLRDFLIPFLTIGLAEVGDKTQIAVLCLATQTKKHLLLLSGVVLAFVVTDGLAVLVGNFITNFIPENYIKIAGGIIFIIFGVITLLNKEKEDAKCELKNPFLTGFGVIFVSEFGDKTQIAAGLFATKYNPVMVFAGVIFVLTVLSLMAIFVGKFLTEHINRRVISYIAGAIFIVIGIIYIMAGVSGLSGLSGLSSLSGFSGLFSLSGLSGLSGLFGLFRSAVHDLSSFCLTNCRSL